MCVLKVRAGFSQEGSMNLDDVLDRDDFDRKTDLHKRILNGIATVLNQMLSAIGVLLFWLFMLALLTSPAWVPALVEGVLIR